MSSAEIFYCTLGMCIVSYLPRVLPPLVLARCRISPLFERWLRYIPTSVFGSLVFSEIFLQEGLPVFHWNNIALWASFFVLLVAVRTHSLGKSIVSGLTVFWLLEHVL